MGGEEVGLNRKKRGIPFEIAAEVFNDPFCLIDFDELLRFIRSGNTRSPCQKGMTSSLRPFSTIGQVDSSDALVAGHDVHQSSAVALHGGAEARVGVGRGLRLEDEPVGEQR